MTESSSSYLDESSPQIFGLSGTPLWEKMIAKEWEAALEIIEDHPEQSSAWQYGIELEHNEGNGSPQLWKRLPIHSACVLRAPVGVVEALHLAYPKGVAMKDPITGALPLHLACRHSSPPDLVKGLVMAHPGGARVADDAGRLPLHQACLSGGSRLSFAFLLQAYPHAVLFKDNKCKTPVQCAKGNPTLNKETVELLEMVQCLLQKQSAFDGDYNFKGFLAPRRTQQIKDQGSVVSGFFEEEESVMSRSQPHSDVELEKKLASMGMESPKEEGNQWSGSDDVQGNKLTCFGVSSASINGGQSANLICLDGSPSPVTHFLDEFVTKVDTEVISCPVADNVDGGILPDNDTLHIGESDKENELCHLNTVGFKGAAQEDLKPIDNLTSADESAENDSSVADDQMLKDEESTNKVECTTTGIAAVCDMSSSQDVPTTVDQVTKEAEVADELELAGPLQTGKVTVNIASHDGNNSGSNEDATKTRMSWLEVGLLELLASRHEMAEPVESIKAPVNDVHEPTHAEASPHKVIAVEAAIPNGGSRENDKVDENESEILSSCNSSIASDLTIWHCNSNKKEESSGVQQTFQVENEQHDTFKCEST